MEPLKSIDKMLVNLQEADWGKSLKFVADQLALRSKDLADIADEVIWQGDNMDGRTARKAQDIQQSIDELVTRLRKELAGFSESKDETTLQDATEYGPYEATDAQLKAEKEIEKQGFRFSNWIPAQDPDDEDHGIMVMSKRGITRFGKEYREIDVDGSIN
jgi:hypothetical protein